MRKFLLWLPAMAAAGGMVLMSAPASANIGFLQKPSKQRYAKRLQMASNFRHVRPVRIAGHDANFRQITPWYTLGDNNDWPNGPWCTVFDCAEISPMIPGAPPPGPGRPNGEPTELAGYGPAYMVPPNYGITMAQPGARWFFGPDYNNPFSTNDIEVSPLYGGSEITRVAAGWYWNSTGAGERMIVALSTAETFSETVAGFPPPMGVNNLSYQGFLSGVLLDFGTNMGAGYAPGFYFVNADLNDPAPPMPLSLKMPEDGKGALILTLLNGTMPSTLATRGQPMLWWSKQTNFGMAGGNPSKHGKWEWDDDTDIATGGNIPDGRHLTDPPGPANRVELYDYSMLALPPPLPAGQPASESLGAMVAMYSKNLALAMETAAIGPGIYAGGTVASLRLHDMDMFFGLGDLDNPEIELVVSTTAPATTTSRMVLIIELSCSAPADVSQLFRLRRWSDGVLETVGSPAPTLTQTKHRIVITGDPSRFIRASDRRIEGSVYVPLINEVDAFDGVGIAVNRLTVEVACPV